MSPGKKKQILTYISRHFGKDPLDFPEASRCRERLDQIRILYNTFYASDEGNVYAFHKFIHDTYYYTDKQLLLEDLRTEQQQMSKKMNNLINDANNL